MCNTNQVSREMDGRKKTMDNIVWDIIVCNLCWGGNDERTYCKWMMNGKRRKKTQEGTNSERKTVEKVKKEKKANRRTRNEMFKAERRFRETIRVLTDKHTVAASKLRWDLDDGGIISVQT